MGERKSRRRGVRLNDLDKSRLYVIGHNGHRWETVGPLDGEPSPGRHARVLPDAERPEAARLEGPGMTTHDGTRRQTDD